MGRMMLLTEGEAKALEIGSEYTALQFGAGCQFPMSTSMIGQLLLGYSTQSASPSSPVEYKGTRTSLELGMAYLL